jgi:glucose-6-phosphate 1-dehydrogenase
MTCRKLLNFTFSNSWFETKWKSNHALSISIIAAMYGEGVGLGERLMLDLYLGETSRRARKQKLNMKHDGPN